MDRQQRLAALMELVVDGGSIRVEDVMERFDVSAATARRDLDSLADQQLLVRTRGGGRANPATGALPQRYRAVVKPAQKAAIAQAACQLVHPGEVIGCNGGTTTTLAAYEIGVWISAREEFAQQGITVVTNAVNIATDLVVRPRVRVVVTGGVVRPRSYELIGPLSELVLPAIKIDTLWLGVNGVDAQGGIYANHDGEASVNAALARAANRVVVLADASKLGRTAFAKITELDAVDCLITDDDADRELLKRLERRGIEVIVAAQATL